MKIFLENTHFRENARPFYKILVHFRVKNFVPGSLLGLNHPCLTSISATKNYDGWRELGIFSQNEFMLKKHISSIMCENPVGNGPLSC